ncbi:MAG: sigma-70 family RNA polymerase sigma factor [Bryobacteraceae bacterium]|nr:sigma-70 family RNA polymerase sigma factor [Bryobacteraceae bacterium]
MSSPSEVTQILLKLQSGDRSVLEQLTPLVYGEMRRLAGSLLRQERSGHTLQATALVHEAYMRLADQSHLNLQSRAHFMAIAARVMRQILVDHARKHSAVKRGSGGPKVTLDEGLVYSNERARDVEALDDALQALEQLDPRKAKIVELRFFGGLTGEEIASALDISTATVAREIRMAQAWLLQQMKSSSAGA